QGDRHPIWLAATRSGTHDDGCCFTPQLQLGRDARLESLIGPGKRHQHACRTTGELGRLMEIARQARAARQFRKQRLLETHRVAAILVIASEPAELAVAALANAG